MCAHCGERRNPGLGDWAQAGILGVVGLALLTPGADGQSALQHITGALQHGINLTPGVPSSSGVPAAPAKAAPQQAGAYNGQPAPTGGTDTFSVNAEQSSAAIVNVNTISAQVGFGHVGSGGTFTCVLTVGVAGTLFGIGATPPTWVAQQDFDVGNDADWTGYHVTFDGAAMPFPVRPGLSTFATIITRDGTGSVYVHAQIG